MKDKIKQRAEELYGPNRPKDPDAPCNARDDAGKLVYGWCAPGLKERCTVKCWVKETKWDGYNLGRDETEIDRKNKEKWFREEGHY